MPIEMITAYKISDGKSFEKRQEALDHQALLDFEVWYEKNELYGQYEGSRVLTKDFIDWLDEHGLKLWPKNNKDNLPWDKQS